MAFHTSRETEECFSSGPPPHACRSLRKAGNEQAFKVDGLNSASKGQISELLLPRNVKIGELLKYTFAFRNAASKATKFRLALHH